MAKYSETLKNPKWQKKRLEILQRDSFQCQCCFDKEKTLHVHHALPDYSIEPWNHRDETLITLCNDCHKAWHSIFGLPYDEDQICLIVKLYERIENAEIERQVKHGTNQ